MSRSAIGEACELPLPGKTQNSLKGIILLAGEKKRKNGSKVALSY